MMFYFMSIIEHKVKIICFFLSSNRQINEKYKLGNSA